jgi:KEOPS complex subunit Cgi121
MSEAEDRDTEGGDAPASSPTPPHRLVAGTAAVDDLDAFLASLDEVADATGAVVQAFDASLIVSATHLGEAARLAARSIGRGEAVARDPGVEIMLYAAGSRQIDRALSLGVEEGRGRVVVLVADFGAVSGADRTDADLDAAVESVAALLDSPATGAFEPAFDRERVTAFYDIGEREREATAGGVADIVRERVALLDVEK